MKSTPRLVALVATVALSLSMLSACSPVIPLTPAADATNPDCAEIMVRLPEAIGEHERRETNAQATAAWGAPAAILMTCGVEVPGPSALPCYTVNGIDWLRDDSQAPNFTFTTFGRDPAVEVFIDSETASGLGTLEALKNSVGTLTATKKCLAPEDVDAPE